MTPQAQARRLDNAWEQALIVWEALSASDMVSWSLSLLVHFNMAMDPDVVARAYRRVCDLCDAVNAAYAAGYEDEGREMWVVMP